MVPEAQDAIATCREEGVANGVTTTFRVLAAVNLEQEARLAAGEIGEVRPDRLLTHELPAGELPIVEAIPEFSLGIGLPGSQSARPSRALCVFAAHQRPLTTVRF